METRDNICVITSDFTELPDVSCIIYGQAQVGVMRIGQNMTSMLYTKGSLQDISQAGRRATADIPSLSHSGVI